MTATPCEAFRWVGQSFASCDRCGQPYWEHTHEERKPDDWAMFDLRPMERVAITTKQAEACKRKWGSS